MAAYRTGSQSTGLLSRASKATARHQRRLPRSPNPLRARHLQQRIYRVEHRARAPGDASPWTSSAYGGQIMPELERSASSSTTKPLAPHRESAPRRCRTLPGTCSNSHGNQRDRESRVSGRLHTHCPGEHHGNAPNISGNTMYPKRRARRKLK